MIKKIVFGVIFFILMNILGFISGSSYFASRLKYTKILGNPLYENKSFKIYIPNKKWKTIKRKVPEIARKSENLRELFFYLSIIGVGMILMIKKKTVHGSARWAIAKDLRKARDRRRVFDLDLLEQGGIVLGKFDGIGSRILYNHYSPTHTLLVGPTRAGKRGVVSTTGVACETSMVFFDVKGEIYEDTAGYRAEKLENIILKFEPMSKDSIKYNPMTEIRHMTEYEIEDSKRIADMLVKDKEAKKSSTTDFFDLSAENAMTAMMIYENYKNDGKGSIGDVLDFITDTSGTLKDRLQEAIYEPLINSIAEKEKLEKLYYSDRNIVNENRHPIVARYFARLVSQPDKTFENIIETLRNKLSAFESPIIKKNTSESNFRLWDLMNINKPVSLYIRVDKADMSMLRPLIKVLMSQMLKVLTPKMTRGKVHKRDLTLVFDEAAQLGTFTEIEEALPFVLGYGIRFLLVFQGLDQIYKYYTKDNSILSNCQVQIYFTPAENTTAEYISKSLGRKTIKNSNRNSSGILSSNIQNQDLGRELLSLDEVLQYPQDKGILRIVGKPPIRTRKIYYWEEEEFKYKIGKIYPPEVEEELKKLSEVKNGKKSKER